MLRNKCLNCERTYEVLGNGHTQLFCGSQCFTEYTRKLHASPYKLSTQKMLLDASLGYKVKPLPPLCIICNRPFIQEFHNQVYCSEECRGIADSLSYGNRRKQIKARGF